MVNETKNIRVAMILEIIGRPAEHLVETLGKIIDEMEKEKGVSVVEKKINEPVLMKDQKDFYTTFAEVEIEVDEIMILAGLMFKYMPAHIEVISPELIALTNNGWGDIFSELTRRLHKYDEVARVLQMQLAQLQKEINEKKGNKDESPEPSTKKTVRKKKK